MENSRGGCHVQANPRKAWIQHCQPANEEGSTWQLGCVVKCNAFQCETPTYKPRKTKTMTEFKLCKAPASTLTAVKRRYNNLATHKALMKFFLSEKARKTKALKSNARGSQEGQSHESPLTITHDLATPCDRKIHHGGVKIMLHVASCILINSRYKLQLIQQYPGYGSRRSFSSAQNLSTQW